LNRARRRLKIAGLRTGAPLTFERGSALLALFWGCHGWLAQPCTPHCWTSQPWHPTHQFTTGRAN